jgi:signal transduction histidine kinase
VLYIIAPYTLAGETQQILDSQRNFTILFIGALAGVAIAAAIAVLRWNKGLHFAVASRTADLEESNVNLQKALEELKVHDKMQKEFINIAAHELRTPVQPILSMAELAQIHSKR